MKTISSLLLIVSMVVVCGVSCSSQPEEEFSEPSPTPELFFTLTGRVLLEGADTNLGAQVFAPGTSLIALTDEKGGYTISGVPAGEYTIIVQKEDYLTTEVARIVLPSARVDKNGVLVLPEAQLRARERSAPELCLGGIFGIVELEEQSDYSGVRVSLRGTQYAITTEESGAFQFVDLTPGTYRIAMSRRQYIPKEIEVIVESDKVMTLPSVQLDQVVPVTAPRRVSGRIMLFDEDGNEVSEFAKAMVGLEGTPHISTLSPDGSFRLEDVQPGVYNAIAAAAGFKLREKKKVDVRYVVQDETVLELDRIKEKEEAGTITGTVVLEDETEDFSGITVGLTGTSHVALTDNDGRYTISGIKPGRYILLAKCEGYIPIKLEYVDVAPNDDSAAPDMTLTKIATLPEVIFTDPVDNAVNVVVTEKVPVFIRFNKKMQPESVQSAVSVSPRVDYTLYLGRANPQSDYDLAYLEMKGLRTENPVEFDTTYTVNISKSARDFEGNNLAEPYRFSFKTGKPGVIATSPSDGSKGVIARVSNYVRVYFNCWIDLDTFTASNVKISPTPQGLNVFGQQRSEEEWSQGVINATLEEGTRYTITISNSVRQASGAKLSKTPYKFTFTTREPRD